MGNIYKGTLGLIGNTPLVEVVNIEKELGLEATLLVKLEYFNPVSYTHLIQLAALCKGQFIVALVVAVVGDEAHLVLPEKSLEPTGQCGLCLLYTSRCV